jgi:hypothetical protein
LSGVFFKANFGKSTSWHQSFGMKKPRLKFFMAFFIRLSKPKNIGFHQEVMPALLNALF